MTNYCPRLREAIAEIRAVCEKYDCGGVVSLSSKEHGEFAFIIPTWSLAQFEGPNQDRIRLRAKSGVHPQEQLESTLHFLMSTRDICAGYAQQISTLEGMVREHDIGLEHDNAFLGHNNDDR